jgi:hypothetical protein
MKFIVLAFMLFLSGCILDAKQYHIQGNNNCRDTCMDLNAYAYTFDLKDHSCKCEFYLKDFD